MEVDLGQPSTIRAVSTKIDLVIRTKTKIDLIIKTIIKHFFITKIETKTNIIEVEEAISLTDSTTRCDFVAHDHAPPSPPNLSTNFE